VGEEECSRRGICLEGGLQGTLVFFIISIRLCIHTGRSEPQERGEVVVAVVVKRETMVGGSGGWKEEY